MSQPTAAFVHRAILNWDRVPDRTTYPFALPAVSKLKTIPLDRPVTFLVGENGSGKSTLLEAIAVAAGFNPEGGSRNFNFATRESHSLLAEYLTLVRTAKRPRDGYFLRAESLFTVATEIERLDEDGSGASIISAYGGRSLHEQSHGEAFLAVMLRRFGGNGLYILDEPEAALSTTRQMAMLVRLRDLVAKGSQLVIATHSPILLALPGARILDITEGGLVQRNYLETEQYQLTRSFLENPDQMLHALFADHKLPQ